MEPRFAISRRVASGESGEAEPDPQQYPIPYFDAAAAIAVEEKEWSRITRPLSRRVCLGSEPGRPLALLEEMKRNDQDEEQRQYLSHRALYVYIRFFFFSFVPFLLPEQDWKKSHVRLRFSLFLLRVVNKNKS